MKRTILIFITLVMFMGCINTDSKGMDELTFIRRTVSELMSIPESQLQNDIPLSDFKKPMDDLDFIQLIMKIDAYYNITTPTDEFFNDDWMEIQTLNSVAQIVKQVRDSKK